MSSLTVIVPVYNVEKYLERSINSLVNQTYKDLEIIIVNDGSTDNSRELLKKYESISNVRVYDKENGGVSSARNYGLKYLNTDYVTFLDSDDFLELDSYELSMQKIEEYNKPDIFSFNYYIYFDENNFYPKEHKLTNEYNYFENDEIIKNFLLVNINVLVCNKIFKTKLFDEIKFPEGLRHEDDLITYKLLKVAKSIVLWNKPMFYYVQHKDSFMANLGGKAMKDYSYVSCSIKNDIKDMNLYKKYYEEMEFFTASRISHMMKGIIIIKDINLEEKFKIMALKPDYRWLYKINKKYKLTRKNLMINILYSFDKRFCYLIMFLNNRIKGLIRN